MRYLFFPFTHMTHTQLNTILTFFPAFHYLPGSVDFKHDPVLQGAVDQGKIQPLFSTKKEMMPVEQKLEEYLAWAQIHKGNDVNLKSLLRNNPYFTSDTSVSALKSKIKENKVDKEVALKDEYNLERDRLFLKMAQLCDEQNERIDLDLRRLDKNRDKLFSSLRGLDLPLGGDQGNKLPGGKDSGAMMTRERIRAWSGCMAARGELNKDRDTPLFVTTSDAVFDYLESSCKDLVNALDIETIKVHENECENKSEWQYQFCEGLMGAIQGHGNRENSLPGVDDRCSLLGQLKLNLFSGNKINKIFNVSDKQVPVCLIKLK